MVKYISMKLFNKLNKVFPLRKVYPILLIGLLIMVSFVIILLVVDSRPNKHFYKMKLSGYISKIEREQYCTYYLIGDDWYMIQSELIDYLFEGDSVFKAEDSYSVNIYNHNKLLKNRIEIQRITIEYVEDYKIE